MNWKLLYAIAIAIAIATISVQSWHLPSVHPLLKISDKDLIKKALASVVAISLCSVCSIQPVYSDSRLNAPTAAGTRVNSDPESLLRYGLPINSKELRDIQESIESAKINLKTRRILYAKGDISNAKALLNKYADKIIATAPKNHINQVKESMSKMNSYFPAFETSIAIESDASAGSLQERKGLDDTFLAQDNLAKELSNLEELMVPDDFRRNIPEEYANLPQLQGRAEVEVVFKKTDGSQFDVDGVLYDDIDMTLILDGYNAPITAGNFIDLVNNKFYDKKLVSIQPFLTFSYSFSYDRFR
jgi:peptidylprolyl isomerase